jgi:hypothetical protein
MRPIPSHYAIVVTLNQGERPSTGKALATFFGLAVTDERSTLSCRRPEWCQRLARPRPARHEVPLYVPMCLPTPREPLRQSHQRLRDGRGLRERETPHSSRRRFVLVATRRRPHEPAVHPESYSVAQEVAQPSHVVGDIFGSTSALPCGLRADRRDAHARGLAVDRSGIVADEP